jgi:hypothetical protein
MVASKPVPTELIVVARDESGGASWKVRAKQKYGPPLIRILECPNPQEAPALWAGAENRTPIRT